MRDVALDIAAESDVVSICRIRRQSEHGCNARVGWNAGRNEIGEDASRNRKWRFGAEFAQPSEIRAGSAGA